MKKIFFAVALMFATVVSAKAGDRERPITVEQLPAAAQQFLAANFKDLTIIVQLFHVLHLLCSLRFQTWIKRIAQSVPNEIYSARYYNYRQCREQHHMRCIPHEFASF